MNIFQIQHKTVMFLISDHVMLQDFQTDTFDYLKVHIYFVGINVRYY